MGSAGDGGSALGRGGALDEGSALDDGSALDGNRGAGGKNPGHPGEPAGLTHLDKKGQARMVDVGHKPVTARMARARARLRLKASTWALLQEGGLGKGDGLAVARIAGIMAAKETPRLIPLCHTVPLSSVEVHIQGPADPPSVGPDGELRVAVLIEAVARTAAQTGVEMEALTAASVAALALYDMCKAHDRAMTIEEVALEEKTGGVRGDYRRPRAEPARD